MELLISLLRRNTGEKQGWLPLHCTGLSEEEEKVWKDAHHNGYLAWLGSGMETRDYQCLFLFDFFPPKFSEYTTFAIERDPLF